MINRGSGLTSSGIDFQASEASSSNSASIMGIVSAENTEMRPVTNVTSSVRQESSAAQQPGLGATLQAECLILRQAMQECQRIREACDPDDPANLPEVKAFNAKLRADDFARSLVSTLEGLPANQHHEAIDEIYKHLFSGKYKLTVFKNVAVIVQILAEKLRNPSFIELLQSKLIQTISILPAEDRNTAIAALGRLCFVKPVLLHQMFQVLETTDLLHRVIGMAGIEYEIDCLNPASADPNLDALKQAVQNYRDYLLNATLDT